MTQPLLAPLPRDHSDSALSGFLVLRQNPETREYVRVGTLRRTGDRYIFEYTERARRDPDFTPLPGFPDTSRTYSSTELFATFANRVMTPRRDSYRRYLQMIGVDEALPDPFEVLARTWGSRATDRIQLLPIPRIRHDGSLETRFLVHGGGHVDPVATALRTVRVGDRLGLRPEPGNPEDPNAVLVIAHGEAGRRLGYVPRPLAPFIHRIWSTGIEPLVIAEHINPPDDRLASNQLRLLARLEARVPPDFDVLQALGDG